MDLLGQNFSILNSLHGDNICWLKRYYRVFFSLQLCMNWFSINTKNRKKDKYSSAWITSSHRSLLTKYSSELKTFSSKGVKRKRRDHQVILQLHCTNFVVFFVQKLQYWYSEASLTFQLHASTTSSWRNLHKVPSPAF